MDAKKAARSGMRWAWVGLLVLSGGLILWGSPLVNRAFQWVLHQISRGCLTWAAHVQHHRTPRIPAFGYGHPACVGHNVDGWVILAAAGLLALGIGRKFVGKEDRGRAGRVAGFVAIGALVLVLLGGLATQIPPTRGVAVAATRATGVAVGSLQSFLNQMQA